MRKLIGMFLEWLLAYDHVIVINAVEGCIPRRGYAGDAGCDLFAAQDVAVVGGGTTDVPSGVRVDPRSRIWLEIKARSSTMTERGLEVTDAVIDRDFRGDLKAIVHNPGRMTVFIKRGMRIVQVIPHRLIPVKFKRGKLSPSLRGERGFGSTGA